MAVIIQRRLSMKKIAFYWVTVALFLIVFIVTIEDRRQQASRKYGKVILNQATIYQWINIIFDKDDDKPKTSSATLYFDNADVNSKGLTSTVDGLANNDSSREEPRRSEAQAALFSTLADIPLVILLTYQRTGSTLLGSLFNNNPNAFYIFEPIDSVYTALYGTQPGWNIPDNIFHYNNGTRRVPTLLERKAVVATVGRLMACDLERLPVDIAAHPFWSQFTNEQRVLRNYTNCLTLRTVDRIARRFYGQMRRFCPHSMGEEIGTRQEECRRFVAAYDLEKLGMYSKGNGRVRATLQMNLEMMLKSRVELSSKVATCREAFRSSCAGTTLRAMKTVRMDMRTAELLLATYPTAKFVHHFRDPRAVARSRMGHQSYRARHATDEIKISGLYCSAVLEDLWHRDELERRFPGRIYESLYEEQVANPLGHAKGVYNFLGLKVPDALEDWLRTIDVKNATIVANKWQGKITLKAIKGVQNQCRELFNRVGTRWTKQF